MALSPQVVSQASQHFRSSEKQTTCEGCFACQSICSVISLHSSMSRAVHSQEFWRWMLTIDTFQSGLPIPRFTFCSKLIKSVRMMACLVWLSPPVEGMGDYFHLHCQAGGWDCIGCTVFMDGTGSCTMLDSEAPQWLVFGDWDISVHYKVLRFSWMRSLISDCFAGWPISTVLSQVFWQECLMEMLKLVWVPFPLLGLLELCQLAYLQYWVLCLTHPRLAPPVCIPLWLSRLCGVGYGDFQWHWSMLWPVPLSVSFASINLMVSMGVSLVVLRMTRIASFCTLSSFSRFVPLLWGLVHSQWHWAPHFETTGRDGAAIAFRTDSPFLHFSHTIL